MEAGEGVGANEAACLNITFEVEAENRAATTIFISSFEDGILTIGHYFDECKSNTPPYDGMRGRIA